MKDVILVDLDGTLCDCAHRVHHAQAKDWDAFHAGLMDDPVFEDVAEVIKAMSNAFFQIIVVTGRSDKHRDATLRWLQKAGLGTSIDDLLMREEGDWRPDDKVKPELVDRHFGERSAAIDRVLFILEDRDQMADVWREAGFRCWQVQEGSY